MAQERDIIWRLEIDQDAAKAALTEVNKEQERLKDGVKALRDEYKKGEISSQEYAKAQTDIQLAQKKLTQEKRDLIKQTDIEKGSVADLENRYKILVRELKNTTRGNEVLGMSYKDAQKEAERLKNELDEFKREIGTTPFGDLKEGIDGIAGSLGGAGQGFLNLQNVFTGGGIVAGIALITELGNAVAEVVSEVVELRRQIEFLSGETGEGLDRLTVQARSIAETFDQDVNEVVKSANSLAKQLNISFEEAFQVIEKGFLAGANVNGDFLDILKEYPAQFEAAGLSAEQAVAIISQAGQEGIFSDKGIDTIKEFGLRIREQTTATQAALDDAFGKEFTDRIFQGINDGSITTVQALEQIVGKLNDTELSTSQVQTIIADTFGGAGEDAGLQFIKTLDNIPESLDQIIDASDSLTASQIANLDANQALADSQNELAKRFEGSSGTFERFATRLQAFGTDILVGIIDGLSPLLDLFSGLFNAFRELADAILPATEEGESFIEFTDVLKFAIQGITLPIRIFVDVLTQVVNGIKSGVESIKAFVSESEFLTTVFGAIGDQISNATSLIKDFLQTIGILDEQITPTAKRMSRSVGEANQEIMHSNDQLTENVKNNSKARRDQLDKEAKQRERERERQLKEQLRLQQREEKAFQDLQDFRVKEAIKAQVEILKAQESSLDQRLEAADKAAQLELELLAQQNAAKLEQEGLLQTEITRIKEEEEAKRLEIEARREEVKAGLIDKFNKENEDSNKAAADAEQQANQDVFDSTIGFFTQAAALGEEFEEVQKGLAVADVLISLQKEIAAINANAAANPANAITAGGAGAAQSAILTGLAIGRATLATASILALAEGGEVVGPSHDNGGVKFFANGGRFRSPSSAIELEGGEGVMKKRAMQSNRKFTVSGTPRQIGSGLNKMFGGKSWYGEGGAIKFQDGGVFANSELNDINIQSELNSDIKQFIADLPTPIVSVREFDDVKKRIDTKESKASIKG